MDAGNDIRPAYYGSGRVDTLDVIQEFTADLTGIEAFYAGNIIKYALRWNHKNGVEDLKKLRTYTNLLIDSLTILSKEEK